MLGGIVQVGGDIPEDQWQKIQLFFSAFMALLRKLVSNKTFDIRVARLLKPVNAVVVLDPASIHFVFTNDHAGGVAKITHADFRGKGSINLSTAIAIVERDLGYTNCFGFSVSSAVLGWPSCDEDKLLPSVEEYYKNEALLAEKLARLVRIDPIFKAREILVEKDFCFVLMPFSNEHKVQEMYRDQIQPTVHKAGLKCARADDIYDNKPIVETIWENILRSNFVIAELTGRNPNVFYELGVAHTVGKEVVLLSQNIDDVPFDLRHLKVLIYEPTPRGADTLVKQLESTLATLVSRSTVR